MYMLYSDIKVTLISVKVPLEFINLNTPMEVMRKV
jgi:hypothetical protein